MVVNIESHTEGLHQHKENGVTVVIWLPNIVIF